jgi:hypothetical protein
MRRILTLLLIAVALTGCERKEPESKSVGIELQGHWASEREYQNEYFGVRVTVPESWQLDKGTIAETNKRAVDFLAGDEKNLRSVMKSAIEQTLTIFTTHRYPVGTPGKSNPSVVMLIENVTRLPGITSPDDYLRAIEETLKLSNKTFTFSPEAKTEDLGGVQFRMRKAKMPIGTMVVHQSFYAKLKGGFVLLLGVNTMAEGDDEEVARIIGSFKAL